MINASLQLQATNALIVPNNPQIVPVYHTNLRRQNIKF